MDKSPIEQANDIIFALQSAIKPAPDDRDDLAKHIAVMTQNAQSMRAAAIYLKIIIEKMQAAHATPTPSMKAKLAEFSQQVEALDTAVLNFQIAIERLRAAHGNAVRRRNAP